jgi:ankyrin repeat protein
MAQTLLLKAAESGHEAIVRLLLDEGAKIETKDKMGKTPVSYAAYAGHTTVMELLLATGANRDTG